jgi:ubiquinone/menaquinone biosynthesis C-methylase UbiE
MLDIGVGGGRTTEVFSKVSQTYIGIDYSKNMITICQKKFKNNSNLFFTFADARDLKIFHDNSFDFILFSHGGLDVVDHSDRLHILNEIRRVAKRNALFSFSTSNLNSMFGYCSIKISKNPKVLCKRVVKLLLVRLLNEELWLYCRVKIVL